MGIDTFGALNKKLSCDEILNKLSKYEKITFTEGNFNNTFGKKNGFLDFDYTLPSGKTEKRSLFILEKCSDKHNSSIDKYLNDTYTHLSLGYSKNSTFIMKDLVKYLGGGVVIPNDCADCNCETFFSKV